MLMLAFVGAILASLALHPRTTTIDAATEAPVTQPIRSEGLSTSSVATAPPSTTGVTTYVAKATAWPTTTVAWTVPPQSQYTAPSSTTAATAKPSTTATTAAPAYVPPTTQPVYIPPPPPTAPPTTAGPGGSSSDLAFLACVRQRESGGNYSINTGNGYYGAYQFSISTWNNTAQHAGRGDLVGLRPDLASPGDQDAMALHLLHWVGRGPWGGYC
jgi:hypothetical protein